MVDVQSGEIYSGAAITTHPIHTDVLLAITLSPENAILHTRMIRLTEKQKNFIHRLKVRA